MKISELDVLDTLSGDEKLVVAKGVTTTGSPWRLSSVKFLGLKTN